MQNKNKNLLLTNNVWLTKTYNLFPGSTFRTIFALAKELARNRQSHAFSISSIICSCGSTILYPRTSHLVWIYCQRLWSNHQSMTLLLLFAILSKIVNVVSSLNVDKQNKLLIKGPKTVANVSPTLKSFIISSWGKKTVTMKRHTIWRVIINYFESVLYQDFKLEVFLSTNYY